MIAPATQPAPMTTAIPPPTPRASARPLRAVDAGLPGRAQRVGRQREEDDPERGAPAARSGICRASRTVTRRARRARPDEGHRQEDDAGRDRRGRARRSCRRSEGLVVHRHVVRQRGRFIAAATSRPIAAERRPRGTRDLVERLECPEAVDDPDLESAAQVRAVAPAQQPVLGQVPAEPRDLVAAVVVEDEQAAAASEDTVRFAQARSEIAAEGSPRLATTSAESSGASIREDPFVAANVTLAPSSASCRGANPLGAIEQQHVAPPDRTQCLERPRDLRLDIEDAGQSLGEPVPEFDREICHRIQSMTEIRAAAGQRMRRTEPASAGRSREAPPSTIEPPAMPPNPGRSTGSSRLPPSTGSSNSKVEPHTLAARVDRHHEA